MGDETKAPASGAPLQTDKRLLVGESDKQRRGQANHTKQKQKGKQKQIANSQLRVMTGKQMAICIYNHRHLRVLSQPCLPVSGLFMEEEKKKKERKESKKIVEEGKKYESQKDG